MLTFAACTAPQVSTNAGKTLMSGLRDATTRVLAQAAAAIALGPGGQPPIALDCTMGSGQITGTIDVPFNGDTATFSLSENLSDCMPPYLTFYLSLETPGSLEVTGYSQPTVDLLPVEFSGEVTWVTPQSPESCDIDVTVFGSVEMAQNFEGTVCGQTVSWMTENW